LIIGIGVGLLSMMVSAWQENERNRYGWLTKNHLRQLAIATHEAHSAFKRVPPAFDKFADVLLPHSLHVYLLPFVEQQSLYQRIMEDRNAPDAVVEVYISPQDVTVRGN